MMHIVRFNVCFVFSFVMDYAICSFVLCVHVCMCVCIMCVKGYIMMCSKTGAGCVLVWSDLVGQFWVVLLLLTHVVGMNGGQRNECNVDKYF